MRKARQILAFVVLACGILLAAYPFISNYAYNASTGSQVMVYDQEIDKESAEQIAEWFAEAHAYNQWLAESGTSVTTDPFGDTSDADDEGGYSEILNVDGSGIMCFVEIPKIGVYLPVYHGTSAETLEKGAGHLQGTAVPIGDVGTRPVISAHTGLTNAVFFSNLTELEEGDYFFIHVLDETLAYQVCEIDVVLPEDMSAVEPEEGRDIVTLLTCTPYGVNTHRLLVTGERVDYYDGMEDEISTEQVYSDALEAYRRALMIGGMIAVAFLVVARVIALIRGQK